MRYFEFLYNIQHLDILRPWDWNISHLTNIVLQPNKASISNYEYKVLKMSSSDVCLHKKNYD